MSDFKCNTVFHQSGGLICEKTLKIQKLQAQLKDANETIKFYGDKDSWDFTVKKRGVDYSTYNKIFSNDLSMQTSGEYGGKRARKYLEKYKSVNSVKDKK
jgi:hypothetical protein